MCCLQFQSSAPPTVCQLMDKAIAFHCMLRDHCTDAIGLIAFDRQPGISALASHMEDIGSLPLSDADLAWIAATAEQHPLLDMLVWHPKLSSALAPGVVSRMLLALEHAAAEEGVNKGTMSLLSCYDDISLVAAQLGLSILAQHQSAPDNSAFLRIMIQRDVLHAIADACPKMSSVYSLAFMRISADLIIMVPGELGRLDKAQINHLAARWLVESQHISSGVHTACYSTVDTYLADVCDTHGLMGDATASLTACMFYAYSGSPLSDVPATLRILQFSSKEGSPFEELVYLAASFGVATGLMQLLNSPDAKGVIQMLQQGGIEAARAGLKRALCIETSKLVSAIQGGYHLYVYVLLAVA